ncbi:hypothetical protein F7725_024926 [Dissostichus mawsoni]|uniref:WH2 domain-containing protein n=1 Tax=Dissostichus mawsoni TaxID=36200 RepID=A0A7J5X9Q6_DISMA|nr:hypothetical protein F7725_024926 [Dissostichus mawsoni]
MRPQHASSPPSPASSPGSPPPPPPSAALPQCPSEPPKLQCAGAGGRNALLADIQNGARLRKVAQVNDRSAPAVENPKTSPGDVSSVGSAGGTPVGPSLGGSLLEASPPSGLSSASLKPLWNPPPPPPPTDSSSVLEHQRTAEHRRSIHRPLPPRPPLPPPPPTAAGTHLHSPLTSPSSSTCSSLCPSSTASSTSGPTRQQTPSPPHLPSSPPPSQVTKPTWLPLQHSHHSPISQPSTPPPPPPPFQFHSAVPGDRSSGCFYPPPLVSSEPSRFPILRDSPLGPPPPPPPPPLPSSYTPPAHPLSPLHHPSWPQYPH